MDRFSSSGRYSTEDECFSLLFSNHSWNIDMATNFISKSKLAYSPSFVTLSYQNGFEYHNANEHINSSSDPSASGRILVSFGQVA